MPSLPPSGIGRPIDLRYPSNRFVLLGSILGGGIAGSSGLAAGEGIVESGLLGVATGGAVFLAWATGRELDPDRPWSAGLASLIAGLLVLAGRPSLGQVALLMLAARIVTRSTGLRPTAVDRGVLVVGSGLIAANASGLPVAFAVAALLIADGYLPGGDKARGWVTAAAIGVAATGGGIAGDGLALGWSGLDGGDWPAAVIAGLAVAGLARRPRVTVAADDASTVLEVGRVWASRVGVAAGGTLAVGWIGGEALVGLGAAWAALACAALPARLRQ